MSSTCDVCNDPTIREIGTAYTADEFRDVVARGFQPAEAYIDHAALQGWSRDLAIRQWKKDLVARSTTGWLLCPTCAGRAARYRPVTPTRSVTPTSEARTLTHSQPINRCAFSPDGSFVVTASNAEILTLWDTASGKELRTLAGHRGYMVTSCAVSPDGALIASAGSDGKLKLWDSSTGAELGSLGGHRGLLFDCAFSPDGAFLVSASGDTTLKIWDPYASRGFPRRRGVELRTLRGHAGAVMGCAVSPDARFIASASNDQTLKLWDAASGRELRTLRGHEAAVSS